MDRFVEHFKLNVEIFGDCTRETWYHSGPGNGIRRQKVIEEWRRHERIGAGAGGEVFEVRSNLGNVRAIKAIRKPENSDLSSYIKELVAMGQLSKDNDLFVELYGWYESDQFLYLAMEYLELGHIGMCYPDCMSELDVRIVAKQLLEGVAKMHEKGIIHRDIKPQNILVFQKDPIWIKIGDFGSSKVIQKNESGPNSLVGTENFAAPEILQLLDNAPETSEYTNAVDLWSVGCVLYYLLSRNLPFPSVKLLYEYCRVKMRRFPDYHLRDKNVSSSGISFIRNLMAREPSERMSASTALVTAWVADETTFPQRHAIASDIPDWQGDNEALFNMGTGAQFEQLQSPSHQQTISISTPQNISEDRSAGPSLLYYYSRPIVPRAERITSDRPTFTLPHHNRYYYYNRPPAEHNSIGRPTVRDHGRDRTVVIADAMYRQSFQQEDPTSTLDYPYHEADWEVLSRDNSERWRNPTKRSRKKVLGADANNHRDVELPRHVASGGDDSMVNHPLSRDNISMGHGPHDFQFLAWLYGDKSVSRSFNS
ncbi:hypothetical protein EYB25_005566 [Talaromyces marneffei]|nr:hypothetical protein EYB25_005566 [Talaromyces marneffei]